MEVIRYLGPQTRLADLEKEYLDRPVGETIGELRGVRHLERALDRRDAAEGGQNSGTP